MKVKNKYIASLAEAISSLSKEKFPAGYSFEIKRVMKQIMDQAEMYNEARNDLVERYAKRDDEGEKIMRDNGASVEMSGGWLEEAEELHDLEGDDLLGLSAKRLIAMCEKQKINIQASVLFGLDPILIDDMETIDDEKDSKEE